MILGALSGAAMGLFFHKESWMGGYSSLRRRMLRLGHIAFFGLGFINILFALSLAVAPIPPMFAQVASIGFTVAIATMSTCCFLTAWRTGFRHLFPIPVAGVLVGLVGLIAGWVTT